MKTTAVAAAATATSHQTRTASSNHTTTNNKNNDNNSRNNRTQNALSSMSGSNMASLATQKHRGNGRVGSGKYYDIASTILGGTGDLETVFLNAAKNGNINKLEQMLSQTGHAALDIDCKDKRTGNTALMWAAKRGHSKVVELLLQHGADPTLCNYEAQTALELGFAPLKTVLLDWVDIDLPLTSLLLLQAAWQGNLAAVRKILSTRGTKDINCTNSEGLTPLMLVSRDVQLFERLSVQLNRHYNPVEVAEELIKAGADIHATDNDGRSSLHYVSQSRATVADRLVSTLITGGMDPELRDKRLFAPIHLASQVGNTNNVVALVDGGSEVNIQGFAGLTPLHITAYNDHQKTTVTLLSHGADVCITDDRGLTPFDLAKTRKMKITLKEAWIDATKDAEEENHSTVPHSGNKGTGNLASRNKADGTAKKKMSGPKKRPEVIFDGVINNEVKENAQQRNTPLSNVEKCKQTEKKILEDLEILKAAHPVLQRENSRILGTTRNKILPQIGRSTSPQHSRRNSPDRSNQVVLLAGEEIRRSWEENRQLLLSRGRSVSDIKFGLGRHSRLTTMTSYDEDILGIDESRECISRASPVLFNNNVPQTPKHHRSGSDPVYTSMADIAASCDNFIPNARGKRNSKAIPLSVNASRVTPSASTFITQQNDLIEEQKQKSQQQEDTFIQAMASPLELLRCRSLLKEDFILAESRPSEMASGSDPASSTSSLSSSSPRDGSNYIPHSPLRSHKLDPSFATLTEVQESNSGSKGVAQCEQVTENMNTSSVNLSQEAKPLIREPQRRIRRNSENSSSTGSIILNTDPLIKTDFPLSFRTGKGIVKSQSLRKHSKPMGSEFNVSNINKSQSLESLSPRPVVESVTADQNMSKVNEFSIRSPSSSSELNPSAQKQITFSADVELDARNERKTLGKCCEMKNDKKNAQFDEQKVHKSQAAPFSGKARIIGSNDMDRWDNVNYSQEQNQSATSKQGSSENHCVFVPVQSSKEPCKSATSQNANENANKNSQVTKSCASAIEQNINEQSRIEEKRPKTSCKENSDTSGKNVSTRNETVKAKHTQETKYSFSSRNQQPKEKNVGATSKPKIGMSHAQQSSTKSNNDRDLSKSVQVIQDTRSQEQKLPLETSLSRPSSLLKNKITTSKSCSQFENSKGEKDELNESHFTVTEESERLGSASKIRMQERLNASKQKKVASSEKEIAKTKKPDEATPTMAKSRSVNRAAQIENSIRKNQVQSSVIRKSTGQSQNIAKSESIATNKKLTRSSENAIGGVTKTFSTSNVFGKSNETSSPSPEKSISKSQNFVRPPEQGLSTNRGNVSAGANPVPTSKCSHSVQEKLSYSSATVKSISASKPNETSSDTVKQTKTQHKDIGTAKALDPNVILTPRSTEPLVKIKFDSLNLSQPANAASVIHNLPSTAVSTPLIVNPFEGFSETHNLSQQKTTTDAVVKLRKASQKSGSSSNKVVKKSTTTSKRPTSGSSRKSTSAGKKRVVKRADSKDETNKEGRVRSGRKRSNQSKKKMEPETTDTKMTDDAAKTDVALISGIGWQLSTSCVDTSNLMVARKVNFQLSSSQMDLAASTDFGDDDNDYHEEENCSENQYQNDDHENKSESQLSPLIDGGDIDSNKNLDPENKALEVFKEKITLNSPRFQEMKRRQESQINFDLPVVTNDGFPPMNLDITQRIPEIDFYANEVHDSKTNSEMSHNHVIQREILMDKLTPIPEASFVSKTINAISQFDKSMPEDKLTELLEDPPSINARLKNTQKKSSDKFDSSSYHADKRYEKGFHNYEYTSSGKAIRRTQSLRDTSKTGKLPRERKFSESKLNDEEDNIEEVIEEILSTTLSSNASTLKGINHGSYMTSTHTLTEGDKNLLLKLKSSSTDSPFHARSANALSRSVNSPLPPSLQDIPDLTVPTEKISSQKNDMHGEIHPGNKNLEQAQVILLQKAQPVSNTELKIATQKEISASTSLISSHESQMKPPLSSRSSFKQRGTPRSNTPLTRSTSMKEPRLKAQALLDKESSHDRLDFTEEEAKQLARVMSSLRHMELHTGTPLNSSNRDGFGGSARLLSKTKKMDMSSAPAIHSASLAVRPSSTGAAAKLRGRFHEVKDSGAIPLHSGCQKGNQVSGSQQEKASTDQHKADNEDSSLLEDRALSGVSRPLSVTSSVADAAEIENFYIDLTVRRGSLTGSECTVDSSKSEDDTIQWKKGNVLGKGAFGTVWCGLTNEGELIAVKQIELTTMDQSKAQREYEKIQEEVELLKTLEHINIVGYLGTSLEDNIVSIFMQFIPGGSLASILARFGALDESVFRRYTMQILEGVNYLHDNDVIHRDLKGANVMLMPTGVIKLIDFGCAKRLCINLNLSQTEILKSMKGTPYWMAPEVVNETGHGKKSDIWSIGCTVFEMATRKPPWADMNPMAAIFAIGLADRPVPILSDKFSPEAINFVSQCLTRDQEKRPSAANLLNHPFLARKNGRKTSKTISNENSSTC